MEDGVLKQRAKRIKIASSEAENNVPRVFCKICSTEIEDICIETGSYSVVLNHPENCIGSRDGYKKRTVFIFDEVFSEEKTNKVLFDRIIIPLIQHLIEAKDSVVFVNGTEAEKMQIIKGWPSDGGLVPRCLDVIFNSISKQQAKKFIFKPDHLNSFEVQSDAEAESDRRYELGVLMKALLYGQMKNNCEAEEPRISPDCTILRGINKNSICAVFVSLIQIYNDTVYDIFDAKTEEKNRYISKKLLRHDGQGRFYVHDIAEVEVKTSAEAFEWFLKGQAMSATNCHTVFTVRLVQTVGDDIEAQQKNMAVSQLSFVDVSGPEESSKTCSTSEPISSTGKINSILRLRECLEVLRENELQGASKVVPFRDCKLTQLFKKCFDGKGRVRLLTCISPVTSDFKEIQGALSFAKATKEMYMTVPSVPRNDDIEGNVNPISAAEESKNEKEVQSSTDKDANKEQASEDKDEDEDQKTTEGALSFAKATKEMYMTVPSVPRNDDIEGNVNPISAAEESKNEKEVQRSTDKDANKGQASEDKDEDEDQKTTEGALSFAKTTKEIYMTVPSVPRNDDIEGNVNPISAAEESKNEKEVQRSTDKDANKGQASEDKDEDEDQKTTEGNVNPISAAEESKNEKEVQRSTDKDANKGQASEDKDEDEDQKTTEGALSFAKATKEMYMTVPSVPRNDDIEGNVNPISAAEESKNEKEVQSSTDKDANKEQASEDKDEDEDQKTTEEPKSGCGETSRQVNPSSTLRSRSFPCLKLKKPTVGLGELVNHLHQRSECITTLKSSISLGQTEFREMAIQLEQDNTVIRQEHHSLVAEREDNKERSKTLTQKLQEAECHSMSLRKVLEEKMKKLRECQSQMQHKEQEAEEIKAENRRMAKGLKKELQAEQQKGKMNLKRKLIQQRLEHEALDRTAKKTIKKVKKILVSVPATPSTSMDTLQDFPNTPGMSVKSNAVTSDESIPQLQKNLEAEQNVLDQSMKTSEINKQASSQDSPSVCQQNTQQADVVPTVGGGAQFVFNEMETLQQKSPCASPLPTPLAGSSSSSSPKADEVQTTAVP